MRKLGRVTAIVGAQTGSEGKGVVSYAMRDEFDLVVRTGAPNAGHSFVHNGVLYKMQTIPCTWPNKQSAVILGPGALVNVEILERELAEIKKVDPSIVDRLFIDEKAGILEDRHHKEEGGIHGEIHSRIGSTGEGVGAARRDRLARNPQHFRLAVDVPELRPFLADTVRMLWDGVHAGKHVMLEGTQGCGLSLIHGEWPHVTTNDTNAAQMAADAGIPPQFVTDTILVARTYPIRVAGPSGPMHKEVSWDEMSSRVGRKVEEFTTVTRKRRRIGEWDESLFRRAVMLNAPSWVALTFVDYISPEDRDKTKWAELSRPALDFVHYIERTFDTRVGMLGTGWSDESGWRYVDARGDR